MSNSLSITPLNAGKKCLCSCSRLITLKFQTDRKILIKMSQTKKCKLQDKCHKQTSYKWKDMFDTNSTHRMIKFNRNEKKKIDLT